jgi:hypothetical protein
MIEVAGPDRIRQDELVRQFLSATGDSRKVVTDQLSTSTADLCQASKLLQFILSSRLSVSNFGPFVSYVFANEGSNEIIANRTHNYTSTRRRVHYEHKENSFRFRLPFG